MIVLQNILSQEIVQKLGWTLLHFVWQAAAAALLLAILLRVLHKSTANLRYIIACFALGLIVLLPVITIQLVPASASYSSAHIELPTVSTVLPTKTTEVSTAETPLLEKPFQPESIPAAPAVSWRQRTTELLEPALPYIVLGWLVGVFGLSIWHLGGWAQLQRLRRKMVKQVDDTLHSKLSQLAERLAVNRAVQLMESALVQVPTIVGWLRPVILLPASALSGLSANQLEALLAHELAHIKRFDYLVNILQTVVEILGFYHPAVWWVSHKIRVERENCCDDLAVSISGDRVCYARALTSMEEIRAGYGQLAVAAAGGSLFGRICRLVGKDSSKTNRFSFIPAATAILLIMALVIPTAFALTSRTKDKSDLDIETKLLDGFRENRSKFKCGVLSWTRTTINDGFGSANWPKSETKGSFQLWWDGKKIATKYTQERIHTGRGRLPWVEKEQGGHAYDGGLFSRKPRFSLYENWLEQIIRWTGISSLDKYIAIIKKNKNVSLDWSIIEGQEGKQIKLIVKELEEDGLSGIRYFDISRGYNQVRDESYNAQGQLRSLQTRKLKQVNGGGWFPVEVDMKAIDPQNGKVELHHRFVLDLDRCSFNEPSAIPEGIFEVSTAKQQEQLNKILEKFSDRSPDSSPEKSENNDQLVCESVENYIAAALAGEDEKAAEFAYPQSAVARHTDDTRQALQGQQVQIVGVCTGDWNALAISSVILADHGRTGSIVFHLKKVILNQVVHWLIDDIDLETLDTIEQEIKNFLSKNPKAKMVIVKPRKAVAGPDLPDGKKTKLQVESTRSEEAASQQLSFGQAVEGVQCRLLADKRVWQVGEVPTFKADVRNGGERYLHLPESPDHCLVQVDGRWFFITEYEPGKEVSLSTRVLDFLPGQQRTGIPLELSDKWETMLDSEVALGAYVRHDGVLTGPGLRSRLKLTPGKHTIRVSFILAATKRRVGIYPRPPIQVLSNPVEIEILPAEKTDVQIEVKSEESAEKLKQLALAVSMHVEDHDDNLPNTLQELKPYIRDEQDFDWLLDNIEYFGKGKSAQRHAAQIPIAYDKALFEETNGTNVLFLDFSVRFLETKQLEKLGISKPKAVMGLDPADAVIYKQLETIIVDLSELTPTTSLSEAIEVIRNSVEPPLKIVVLWRDLLDNADIEPSTEINMDRPLAVRLATALEFLLKAVSDGFVELGYIVENGVITIGTLENLPSKLEMRVYHISDLVKTIADTNDLIHRITDTIEPDKWYELSETGEGTIMPYPRQQPKKLAIRQTRKIHQKIKSLLEDIRSSQADQTKTKPAIQIESRFLMVSEEFLKDISLDPNSIQDANAWPEPAPFALPASDDPNIFGLILSDLNISFLLKAAQAQKGAKLLVSPLPTVLDGKRADLKVMKGLMLQLTPKISPDGKYILLNIDFELSELIGFETHMYKDKYPYETPEMDTVNFTTRLIVPDGGTLLIGGQKITEEVRHQSSVPILSKIPVIGGLFRSSANVKEQKTLLILIKPTILPQQHVEEIDAGKVDYEESTEPLARQLEYRLKRATEPK